VSKLGCVRGDRRVFSGLDFSVPAGTFVRLTGPNGSGKTSLLRILCGLLAPAEGQIAWHGKDIKSLGEDYFTSVTYLGHRPGVKDELSAVESLRTSSGLGGIEISKERAQSVIDRVGLGRRGAIPTRFLSEGQRKRVSLARLAVAGTSLWLLDEITTSLDKSALTLVRSLIEEHLVNGGIAIVATHQEIELTGSTLLLELVT
jgi:heme exporter protein A